jgi:ABC-type nitrate/sulfonate/bicarbonate transport system substrate-binding protein
MVIGGGEKMAGRTQWSTLGAVALVLVMGLTTFGLAASPPTAVRVGMTPFFDYQFFAVAKEFGWDKELGLDLRFTWFTQSGPSTQALARGSIDTVNTCVVCNFAFYVSMSPSRS